LQAAQAQIIEKEKLDHELQVAYQIQMSILPRSLPELKGYDFGAMMVPARVVGGDFYDIFSLGRNKIGIMIGDVADKGMPSAIFMARTHALLYAELNRGAPPVRVLKQVNRYLGKISASPLFVTVLLGVLDTRSGEFHYGRAGHELPILVHADGRIERLPWTEGQLLGILDDPLIDEQRVIIPSGGMLLLYTDGVADERDPHGHTFGLDGVIDTLRVSNSLPAKEICTAFLGRISSYQQGVPQDDDITMIIVKRNLYVS
jgi:sigma-B regulation protein RsbU (phosphoserine phosphatase)